MCSTYFDISVTAFVPRLLRARLSDFLSVTKGYESYYLTVREEMSNVNARKKKMWNPFILGKRLCNLFSMSKLDIEKTNYRATFIFSIMPGLYLWGFWHYTIWAMSWENLLMPYANNKGTDQPAHLRSLISAFVVRCLDSIILLLAIAENSRP